MADSANDKLQMVWILLLAALALVAIGFDALDLAKYARAPTDLELDELIVGKGSPPLPQASRDYFRNKLSTMMLVQYLQLLGIVFIVAGMLCGVVAYLLWHSAA
jgi:hypothetical protein